MKINKQQKGILIGILAIVSAYFIFFRNKSASPTANADGTLDIASEKPIETNAGDPNAVNTRSGQPIR